MFVLILILKIILYIFLGLVLFLILTLVLPFSYAGEVIVAGGISARYSFGWPGRLIQVVGEYAGERTDIGIYIAGKRAIRLKRKQKAKLEEIKEEITEEVKKETKRKVDFKDMFDKSFIEEILHYIKRVLNITKPKYLHISGSYGFDDPALTGITYGLISMIRGCIPQARLDFHPDFTGETLELELQTEGDLIAAPILYQTIRTALRKPVREKIFRKRK